MLLRECVDVVDRHNRLQVLGNNDLPAKDIAVAFSGLVKLGTPTQNPLSILVLENCSTVDRAFQVCTSILKLSFLLISMQIHEHRYLKVNYKSMVDWKQTTDHLWCNL